MSRFSELTVDGNNLLFVMIDNQDNQVDISMVNAIRRTILSEVPVAAIIADDVVFIQNTSVLHNDYLSDRLKLLPIRTKFIEEHPPETVEISLNKRNDTDHTISVTTADFIISNIYASPEKASKWSSEIEQSTVEDEPAAEPAAEEPAAETGNTGTTVGSTVGSTVETGKIEGGASTKIQPADVFASDTPIFFTKLKPGDQLHFTATVKVSTAYEDGAVFSPACMATHIFAVDEKALEEQLAKISDPMQRETQRLRRGGHTYLKNEWMQPAKYLFRLESVGQMDAHELFKRSLVNLISRLEALRLSVEENQDIDIHKAEIENMDAIDFYVKDQTDTLGNMVSEYLRRRPDVCDSLNGDSLGLKSPGYAGYLIPHPLEDLLIFRLALADKPVQDIEESKKVFVETIVELISRITELLTEWSTVVPTKKLTEVKTAKKKIKAKKTKVI